MSALRASAEVPQTISRLRLLKLVRAALANREYTFARQASLDWLAAYPGDLEAGLLYARSLLAESQSGKGRLMEARQALDRLCQTDPEFSEAVQARYELGELPAPRQTTNRRAKARAAFEPPRAEEKDLSAAWLFALLGPASNSRALGKQPAQAASPNSMPENEGESLPEWSRQLRQSRQALSQSDFYAAEDLLRPVLGEAPSFPLVGLTHLRLLSATPDVPWQARRSLGEYYHARWPDCVGISLLLADSLMASGMVEGAVALLHDAAAKDIGGQVPARLWGPNHRYRSLWPEALDLEMRLSLPVSLRRSLNWNWLPPGDQPAPQAPAPERPPEPTRVPPFSAIHLPPNLSLEEAGSAADPFAIPDALAKDVNPGADAQPTDVLTERVEVGVEVANRPVAGAAERRLPVYVVFSSHASLEIAFGPEPAEAIIGEMKRLVQAVPTRQGWNARLFLADDPACTGPLGIKPAKSGDAWSLKLALTDLDQFLAKKGERIGAVLIVGGPEVVPFHRLPNPVDDPDADIPSDNPYASSDENFFIPEWPIGRLPGDANLIMNLLRRIRVRYAGRAKHKSGKSAPRPWLSQINELLNPLVERPKPSLGYTAAVWREAARQVYRPIGKPRSMLVSPPLNAAPRKRRRSGLKLPVARLGYFNLHGVTGASEWYGQRDPQDASEGEDYPVALRLEDVDRLAQRKAKGSSKQNGSKRSVEAASGESARPALPEVIFSEACYGAQVDDRTPANAMALKFLACGSQAVAGSTVMSYGSIEAPLIAADLLGQAFWNALQEGAPAGEALRLAKIALAQEMDRRQGFLDGEDQKTLISYVLFGDPLAQTADKGRANRRFRNLPVPRPYKKTYCSHGAQTKNAQAKGLNDPDTVPPEVLKAVKAVVKRYLPGMSEAQLSVSKEVTACKAGECCPNCHPKAVSSKSPTGGDTRAPARRLVTLSKGIEQAGHLHTQVAHLTVDEDGQVVKLVVSR